MSGIRKNRKNSLKTHFMDYGKIDFLSTSQGRTAADASLGVTNRIISGSPEDVFRGHRRDLVKF